jgi:hypothetical protein
MKMWIASVLLVFGMVELYQWMKHVTVPLPAFILGGALLAIASNYRKYAGWSFQQLPPSSDTDPVQTPQPTELRHAPNWAALNPSSTEAVSKPTRSISFTIRHREREEVRHEGKG